MINCFALTDLTVLVDAAEINKQKRFVHVQCCFMSTRETIRTIRDREPRTATSTFTQLLSSVQVHCRLITSTETIRTVRDGEPRTATSASTHLLGCSCLRKPSYLRALYV